MHCWPTMLYYGEIYLQRHLNSSEHRVGEPIFKIEQFFWKLQNSEALNTSNIFQIYRLSEEIWRIKVSCGVLGPHLPNSLGYMKNLKSSKL